MNAYSYRFEKVLTYREQQKTETETEYKSSIDAFEIVATMLYDLLKKKEDTLAEQQERLKSGFSIDGIHHYVRFVDSLEKKIAEVQQEVLQARSKMTWYEEKLLERTIEVKKFEKMKENDREDHRIELEHQDAIQLDELSTLSFGRKEIR
ncbi:flagellar export protein FliJ [Sporosarcina siberiensis]|uniref:Flagellar FliJ protein n=1 Tax=Sporosarcina siberiensis TaxID=1365606 RepID=A0ABW4SGR2_9BACL